MKISSKSTARPLLACEIFADRVVAARSSPARDFVEIHTSRSLPAGAVTPSLTGTNVADSSVLNNVLREALDPISGRTRDVIAVLPDASVRIVLLEFDALPQDAAEATGVIRFRLKKSLPFDVEKSVISFHANRAADPIKVVAAVALASVLEEYERAFRDAGYAPGIVLPGTLAALGAVEGDRPTLVVKVAPTSASLAIVDQGEVRLLRQLESSAINGDSRRLADEIYPSLVFFEDQFHSGIERILVAGMTAAAELAPALKQHVQSPVEELVRERYVSGSLSSEPRSGMLGGVVGALLS
jgi:type IV pilus assembly protein PilM